MGALSCVNLLTLKGGSHSTHSVNELGTVAADKLHKEGLGSGRIMKSVGSCAISKVGPRHYKKKCG